jgi:excinuclease ABC subunit B
MYTAGRAARNINSKVIFYADKITNSMQKTMDETERRRAIQLKYNEEHGITPRQIVKSTEAILGQTSVADALRSGPKAYVEREGIDIAADPLLQYMNKEQIEKVIAKLERQMKAAVKELDFIEAARFRDEIFALREKIKGE